MRFSFSMAGARDEFNIANAIRPVLDALNVLLGGKSEYLVGREEGDDGEYDPFDFELLKIRKLFENIYYNLHQVRYLRDNKGKYDAYEEILRSLAQLKARLPQAKQVQRRSDNEIMIKLTETVDLVNWLLCQPYQH